MNLRSRDVESLARFVIRFLEKEGLVVWQDQTERAVQTVCKTFEKNFTTEAAIDSEARKLLEANRKKMGIHFDEDRALALIKRQLAKEKGFVL